MVFNSESKLLLSESVLDFPFFGRPIRRRLYIGWLKNAASCLPVGYVLIHEHYDGFVEWIYVDEPFRRRGIATEMLYALLEKYPKIDLKGVTPEEEALYESFDRKLTVEGKWQFLETETKQVPHTDDDFPMFLSTTGMPWSTESVPLVCSLYHVWDISMEYTRPALLAVPSENAADGLWILDWESPSLEKRDEFVARVRLDLESRARSAPR